MTKKRKVIYRTKAKHTRRGRRHNSSINIRSCILAGIYGASRGYISKLLEPLTSKIPLGIYADNAAVIGTSLLLKKFIKNKTISDLCNTSLTLESALIGSELATNISNRSNSGNISGWL